jgi:hypothetical protein
MFYCFNIYFKRLPGRRDNNRAYLKGQAVRCIIVCNSDSRVSIIQNSKKEETGFLISLETFFCFHFFYIR